MNPVNPQDPLAAMKQSSPGDPIIPVFEHVHSRLDALKSHAKSIARDAAYLRNTRNLIFLIACLLSAGAGSAGTWYELRKNPPVAPPAQVVTLPSLERQMLQKYGVQVALTDYGRQLNLTLTCDYGKGSTLTANEQGGPGFFIYWRKP